MNIGNGLNEQGRENSRSSCGWSSYGTSGGANTHESWIHPQKEQRRLAGRARHLNLKTVSFWDLLTADLLESKSEEMSVLVPPQKHTTSYISSSFIPPLHFHPCNPGNKKRGKRMVPWSNCDPAEHRWKPESWFLWPVLMAVSHSLIKLPPGCLFSGP